MVHEMPKAFGNVARVMIDESPLDAFMFGIDINDQMTLELDALLHRRRRASFDGDDDADGRRARRSIARSTRSRCRMTRTGARRSALENLQEFVAPIRRSRAS